MASDVMTVVELAEYLKLDRQTIYRRFRRGQLPGVRIGKAIRFKRDVIDNWFRAESYRWTAEQREQLRKWTRAFAKERGIRPQEVQKAISARRRAAQ